MACSRVPIPIKQKGMPKLAVEAINKFPRQALQARTLKLAHPENGEQYEFTAPLADDIRELIETLKTSHV